MTLRGAAVWLSIALVGCGAPAATTPPRVRTPAASPEAPPGVWQRLRAMPAVRAAELLRGEEPAPGRGGDGPTGISGYCPPRADLYQVRGGRIVVLRDPCSGPMSIAIRDPGGDERPIDGVTAFGAGMARRALPLSRDRVVLIIEPGIRFGPPTTLLVIDLGAARADLLRLPRELETAHGLEVAVAGGRVFVTGGVTVGPGEGPGVGCPEGPSEQGCDPSAPKAERPNQLIFAIRPR